MQPVTAFKPPKDMFIYRGTWTVSWRFFISSEGESDCRNDRVSLEAVHVQCA